METFLTHNRIAVTFVWWQIGDKIDTQILWPWKHFFASKIVLWVIGCCLRGIGSMSSSHHIPCFIVLFSSGHCWLFFLASLWAYVVLAPFLCLRVIGSSFRRLCYILEQVLDINYRDIYCTNFTCISYTLPFWLGTLLLCYLVTLLPWYSVTLVPCYLVTLLPCYPVTMLPCYPVTLLLCYFDPLTLKPCHPVTLLPCDLVTLLPCNVVTLLPCYPVTHLPCYPVTLLICYLVKLLPCYPVTLVPCYPVPLSPCYSVTLLPCYLGTFYLVTLLPCYHVTLSCYLVTLLPCYLIRVQRKSFLQLAIRASWS